MFLLNLVQAIVPICLWIADTEDFRVRSKKSKIKLEVILWQMLGAFYHASYLAVNWMFLEDIQTHWADTTVQSTDAITQYFTLGDSGTYPFYKPRKI